MRKVLAISLILLSGCTQHQDKHLDTVRSVRLLIDVGYHTINIVNRAYKLPPLLRYYYIGKHVYEQVQKSCNKNSSRNTK